MKRGINLRGFEIELDDPWFFDTVRGAGPELGALTDRYSRWYDMKLAEYFGARGKLTSLDAMHDGWTALTKAASEGHLDILKALIAAGANKDEVNGYDDTPLTMAAINGHVECVKALLAWKADVNEANRYGYGSTPLMHASFNGDVEIMKLLLAAGAESKEG